MWRMFIFFIFIGLLGWVFFLLFFLEKDFLFRGEFFVFIVVDRVKLGISVFFGFFFVRVVFLLFFVFLVLEFLLVVNCDLVFV